VNQRRKLKPGESRWEVLWSTVHHGQHAPERPWCAILRSLTRGTGALRRSTRPGDPSDGIRYMRSFATREEAVEYAAEHAIVADPRYKRAKAKFDAVQKQVHADMLVLIGAEAEQLTPGKEPWES